jgi:DNA-directed RNA polymerase subunit RPC12/RpoP
MLALFTLLYIFGLPKWRAWHYSVPCMATFKTIYKCRECGATSYQQVIDREPGGALKPTGQYRCTGCRNIFATIRAWWEPRRVSPDFQPSSFPG